MIVGDGHIVGALSRNWTWGVGCIIRGEGTAGDGFVTSIGRSWPRTVGNVLRGSRSTGDGWVRSSVGGDRAKGVSGSVTTVCWD